MNCCENGSVFCVYNVTFHYFLNKLHIILTASCHISSSAKNNTMSLKRDSIGRKTNNYTDEYEKLHKYKTITW